MTGCPHCGQPLAPDVLTCPHCQAEVALWIARAGAVYGPYSRADLQRAQAEGRLGQEDQIAVGSTGQWQPLAEFLQGAAPPPKVELPPPVAPRPVATAEGSSASIIAIVLIALFGFMMVLAVLAAILFPVFAKSREKARQTSCLANLKQISLGLLTYAQDYEERFPPAPRAPEAARLEDGLVASSASFNGSTFYAPDCWRARLYPYLKNQHLFVCPVTQSAYSYQFNDRLYQCGLSEIRAPAETLGAYETGLLGGSSKPPHNGGYNVGYVDGHCKWLLRGAAGQQFDP